MLSEKERVRPEIYKALGTSALLVYQTIVDFSETMVYTNCTFS